MCWANGSTTLRACASAIRRGHSADCMLRARYDFMSDMACVVESTSLFLFTECAIKVRWGIRTNAGRRYERYLGHGRQGSGVDFHHPCYSIPSIDNAHRIAFHLGQIPWLGICLGYIPGAAGPLNMLLEHGRSLAKKRVARGSSSRDLFYYLVRAPSYLLSECC